MPRLRLRLLAALAFVVVSHAACGDDPTAPGFNVGPEGGTVVSDDGRARLTIEPGALTTGARIAIFGAEPSAEAAADPLHVARTSFRFETSSPIGFTKPQLLEISTGGPLVAPRSGVITQALSIPNEPTCDPTTALETGAPLQSRWYMGDGGCPSRCEQLDAVFGAGPVPNLFFCGPKDIVRYPAHETCPAPYVDTGTATYNGGFVRVCQLSENAGSPALTQGTLKYPCVPTGTGFACIVGSVPSQPHVQEDTAKPVVKLTRGADGTDPVTGDLLVELQLEATDDKALDRIEVREVTGLDLDLENPSLVIASKAVFTTKATGAARVSMSDTARIPWPIAIPAPRYFFGRAVDKVGNTVASFPLTVTRGPDSTPPTVSLSANPLSVMPPGKTTVTATATDDVGVTRVEFYKGAALVGTDTTPADGFIAEVTFAAGESGSVPITAMAFDAAGHSTTSAPLAITLIGIGPNDVFISPTGLDTNTGSQAAPFKTLDKAASSVPTGATIWLEDGTYPGNGSFPMQLPAGASMRALHSGAANVNTAIVFLGSGAMSGINFDNSYIEANTGVVQLSAITVKSGGNCGSGRAGINVFGTAKVTLDSGGDPNFGYYKTPSLAGFAILRDSGELTINGGKIVQAAAHSCSNSGVVTMREASKISLQGVAFEASPGRVFALYDTASVALRDSTIDGGLDGLYLRDQSSATLVHSTITNIGTTEFDAGIVCGFGTGGESCTVSITEDSTISKCGTGIDTRDAIVLTMRDSKVVDNRRVGIRFGKNATATFDTVIFSGNETVTDGGESGSALDTNSAPFTYDITMRNSHVFNNGFNGTSFSGAAIFLRGSAISKFDFGTKASPGANVFEGNRHPGSLKESSPAGVTVLASGNTWNKSDQSTDADGHYVLGATPCSATTCDVTTGTGTNYTVTSGTLRLVDP